LSAPNEPSPDRDAGGDAIDRRVGVDLVHRLRFTRNLFAPDNPLLAEIVSLDPHSPRRVLVFVDSGVASAWPRLREDIMAYAASTRALRLAVPPIVVDGGEDAKNDRAVMDEVHMGVHLHGLCRRSYIIAIGGGALLDAVGYAAATAHRGVRLIRVPTTTLAQDDAGIGVKNGINLFGKKNFVGTFAVPWAVLNDEAFLTTLADRDFRSGLSEVVKVALLKDPALFERVERDADALCARDPEAARHAIRRSAELHLEHIVSGGDPFEMDEARPLDFGHWSAHRLEQMTGFDLRHGEAVAIGLALDCRYAALMGMLDPEVADRVAATLRRLGLPTRHYMLAEKDSLLDGLEEFREHLGGRLTITLIRGVGTPLDVHEIDRTTMSRAIDIIDDDASDSAASMNT